MHDIFVTHVQDDQHSAELWALHHRSWTASNRDGQSRGHFRLTYMQGKLPNLINNFSIVDVIIMASLSIMDSKRGDIAMGRK